MPDPKGRSESWGTFPFAFPPWALGAVLAALAFLGNLLHLSLFFGVDYVFGSIAALLAAVWLGPVAGVAVAAVGGLYTLELWGHPWALAIFALEAGIVGLLWRRLGDLILADLLFWVVIGVPLIFLAYKGAMGMDWESAGLIALKQPVNGVFNALVVISVLYFAGWGRVTVTLRQLVFNTLFGAIFLVGLVLIAVFTRALHTVEENLVGDILQDRRPAVVSQLRTALAESDGVDTEAYPPIATQMGVGLILSDGRLLPARGLPEWIGRADKRGRGQGVAVWLPPAERQLPAMERWERGHYAVKAPLPTVEGVSAAVLTQSARPVVERLARANISAHGLLVLVALVGALFSYFFAGGLVRPFRSLEEKVRGLPGRIEAGQRPELPITSVRESSRLTAAFEDMALTLERTIQDLDAQRAMLEDRVRERTRHLEEANQALQDRENTLHRVAGILDATPDFVGLGKPDGTVLYINNGGRRLLGLPEKSLSEADFALRPIPETEVPANWGHPEWAYRIVQEEGIPTAVAQGQWEGETALLDNEGREIPVSQLILAHYDDQGGLLQVSTIMRDISTRYSLEEQLRREKALTESILASLPGVFYMLDEQGRLVQWNDRLETVTGRNPEEMQGADAREFIPDEEQDRAGETIAETFTKGGTLVEIPLRTVEGETPYLLNGFRVELAEKPYILGVGLDISERRALEEQLRREKTLFESMLGGLPGVFYMLDEKGRLVYWNDRMVAVTGRSPNEMQGVDVREFAPEDEQDRIGEAIAETFTEGTTLVESRLRTPEGETPYLLNGLRVELDSQLYMLGMGLDISEQKRLERELEHEATTDRLTGLPNRQSFDSELERALARHRRYGNEIALVMIDLDHFKRVNDAYGHDVGDRVLVELTKRLAEEMREPDFLARWGGEEFVALLPETGASEAAHMGERLRRRIEAVPFPEVGMLTISLGVISFRSEDTANSVLKRVDDALYAAKDGGRNRVVVDGEDPGP